MEIKISTQTILKVLHVLSWIIFVGLCIEAVGILTKTVATLTLNPNDAAKFWKSVDLTELYQYNQSQYITLSSVIIITASLKAILFYCIIKIFLNKNLNIAAPFNNLFRNFILTLAYISLGIGLFSSWGIELVNNLSNSGLKLQDIQQLQIAGSDVWLFMGVILFVVAYIFKKGIELQEENELTI
ncbi:hypothetical protein ACHRVW_08955 [Flavobacterium collinsii]|uniref:hypothetical protein n=1 Tax=Flavobacterium collinsii TaxID=1114861 RepID=UPI00375754DF